MNYKKQGKSGQQSFPARLLSSLKPSMQPIEEPPYTRAKSKPIKDLFPKSCSSVEYFIQYKEKLALSIARQVARDLLGAEEFTPGDYKLIFKPKDAGTTSYLFESIRHTDIVGLKLIKGSHEGKEVRVVEMRYKKKTSVAQKGVELELGAPHMRAMMSPDTIDDALSDLNGAMQDNSVAPEKKERLAPLLAALLAEKHGQEHMMLEACGRDHARLAKAKRLVARIGEEAAALEKANGTISNPEESNEKKMSVAHYVGALGTCPLSLDLPRAKQMFDEMSAESRALAGEIAKECLMDVLPQVYGVAILEHTAYDSISQLQSLLRLVHSRTEPCAERPLLEALREFDSRFVSIHGIIGGSAREQSEIAEQGANLTPESWFLKLNSTINTRKKLLHEILELEKAANGLASKAGRGQAKKIIANMAFNLCRIGGQEAALMERLAAAPCIQKDMKKWQRDKVYRKSYLRHLPDMLEGFRKAASAEAKKSEEFAGKDSGGENGKGSDGMSRYRFKDEKKRIDENIGRLILELQETAPALGDILSGYFRRYKMHVNYKQKGMMPESPQNALTRLAIALRLHEIEADPAKREEYAERRETNLREAALLFALLWGNHGSRSAIFEATKPTRYFQEKGFDMVGNPEKHISTGNTTSKLEVEYSVSKKDRLSFAFMGMEHSIELDFGNIYEAGLLSFDFGESEKSIHEDIFGRRITLGDVMPSAGAKGSQEVFCDLYHIAMRDPAKFDEVRADMTEMEMGNARFLSTIAMQRNRHSGCMAKFGDAIVENLPLKCDPDSQNTFAPFIGQNYPDAADGEADARNFAHQQMAKRAVDSLTVNKPRIAREFIRSILSEGAL